MLRTTLPLLSRLAALAWLLSMPAPQAAAQDRLEPIVATDLLKLQQLGSVAVSPDGRQVVYTVRFVQPAADDPGSNAYRTQLFIASADGREVPRQLTFGDQDALQPAWHPDGDRIAFVRSVDGRPQVFVLPLIGGEAVQLTRFPHGASHPQWSPDGTMLLFMSTLTETDVRRASGAEPRWPVERPGRSPADTLGARPDPDGTLAEVRAWLDRNAGDRAPRVFTRLDLQGELDLEPEMTFRHLYVIDMPADPDDAPASDAAPRALTRGYDDFSDPVWTADGRQVIFSGTVVQDRHPDRVLDRALYVVNADGSGFRTFLRMDGYALSGPVVSPGGRLVAFLATAVDDPGYAQTELGVVGLTERVAPEIVTAGFDRPVFNPRWADDGWYLYFTAASDGGFPLYRVRVYGADEEATETVADVPDDSLDAGAALDSLAAADALPDSAAADSAAGQVEDPPRWPIERLTGFDRGVQDFDVSRATVFYVATDAANPYELYAANLDFTRERRLTEHNARWLSTKRLSVPEPYVLRRDSLEIPYWIMKPTVPGDGEARPLLVQMHGGPAVMWGPGEATMWFEFQYFAARGYGVVFGNPRGSEGYGDAFRRANYRDWSEGPAGDVLAMASEAARQPWVDSSRLYLTGGSYAGYLTAWIVAHDDRFRAAVAQRGVYDLGTFLGEGNAWRLVPWHFGGYPWDAFERSASGDTTQATVALAETVPASTPPDSTIWPPMDPYDVDSSLNADTLNALIAPDSSLVEAAYAVVTDSADVAVPHEEQSPSGVSAAARLRDELVRQSPLTYADRIRTPLLIMHADKDLRTGVSQSEALYKSLKILERPVEYVRYPDAGHEMSRSGSPRQRMDRILRMYEFFERFR